MSTWLAHALDQLDCARDDLQMDRYLILVLELPQRLR